MLPTIFIPRPRKCFVNENHTYLVYVAIEYRYNIQNVLPPLQYVLTRLTTCQSVAQPWIAVALLRRRDDNISRSLSFFWYIYKVAIRGMLINIWVSMPQNDLFIIWLTKNYTLLGTFSLNQFLHKYLITGWFYRLISVWKIYQNI